jgi:hypothetical protein
MKKIFLFAGLLILCGSVAAQAMGDLYVSGTWRYKMTVVVETPEGIKTGSAVREISNSTSSVSLGLPQATNPATVRGEAVVVDLGKRGVLFALISDQSDEEFYQAFPVPGSAPATMEGIKYYNSLKIGSKATLDPTMYPGYPMLVTFTDTKDLKSIEKLMQWEWIDGKYPVRYRLKENNFEKFFGEGVKLKEITFEIVNSPLTSVIGKYLGRRRAIGPYEFLKGESQ